MAVWLDSGWDDCGGASIGKGFGANVIIYCVSVDALWLAKLLVRCRVVRSKELKIIMEDAVYVRLSLL